MRPPGRGSIIRRMAGTSDDTQRREETAPAPPPPRTPAPPRPAPAAERLSVIWLRDTRVKPQQG